MSKIYSLKYFSLYRCAIREPIQPEERLMVTLRYLATGESFHSLHFQFRLGVSTVGEIVRSTCLAIFSHLHEEYLHTPRTSEEWERIAFDVWDKWDFPNALGGSSHLFIISYYIGASYFLF
jgi:hypothetical protein